MNKKELWKKILQIAITVHTAIATTFEVTSCIGLNTKRAVNHHCPLVLDYQDSNLEKQDQNLLCYHYTIVQSFNRTTRSVFDDAKIRLFHDTPNIFKTFFIKKNFFLSYTLKIIKKRTDFAPIFSLNQ